MAPIYRVDSSSPLVVSKLHTALHYEFTEFHRRINAPLTDTNGTEVLDEYVSSLLSRMQGDEETYWETALCLQMLDLVQIIVREEYQSGQIPSWLFTHGNLNIESFDDLKFWTRIKCLAILDLRPLIVESLESWLLDHSDRSVELLLGFYRDVPSLCELDSIEGLEKRRNLAALGKEKSGGSNADVSFIWDLQICDQETEEKTISEIKSFCKQNNLPWYWEVCLLWVWLHPADSPGELLAVLAAQNAEEDNDNSATVLDASLYALLTFDFPAFFIVISDNWPSWFSAICVDYLFYTNNVLAEIRDELLLKYVNELIGSPLGTRMAVDIVSTLSKNCAVRGSRELLGRLSRNDSLIGRTKQWLLCVKLAHDLDCEGASIAESLCMEEFHYNELNVVDAVYALCVAAEVGKDVHLGACRISDYVDRNIELVKKGLERANECSLNQIELLPEYIQSGRSDFVSKWVTPEPTVSSFVLLVTSPNCPPECVLAVVLEIRSLIEKNNHITVSETIAVQSVLIENNLDKSLLIWFATNMARTTL